jgi:hypothetical protein
MQEGRVVRRVHFALNNALRTVPHSCVQESTSFSMCHVCGRSTKVGLKHSTEITNL